MALECAVVQFRPRVGMFTTPDSMVSSLRKYHELGVNRFLVSGFESLEDIRQIGEELIPRQRAFA